MEFLTERRDQPPSSCHVPAVSIAQEWSKTLLEVAEIQALDLLDSDLGVKPRSSMYQVAISLSPQSFLLKLFYFLRYNTLFIEWRDTDKGTQEKTEKERN